MVDDYTSVLETQALNIQITWLKFMTMFSNFEYGSLVVHKFNVPNHDWCLKGNQEYNKNATVLMFVIIVFELFKYSHFHFTYLVVMAFGNKKSESLFFFF